MNLKIVMVLLLLCTPLNAQVKGTIDRSSRYADSVLRQLVRASQLAAERHQSIVRGSSLRDHETTGIRRQSTLSPANLSQLDRLSAFAGDRLRALEESSEFRESEISRMQADYQDGLPGGDPEVNEVAVVAEKQSTMSRPDVERMLRQSDAQAWARRVRQRAIAADAFGRLLRQRSLSSPMHQRQLQKLSSDQ